MEHRKGIHGPHLSSIQGPLYPYILSNRFKQMNLIHSMPFLFSENAKELEAGFHNPFFLPDMQASVACLARHIQKGSKILIYGDRDSDGVSSTALLSYYLRKRFPQLNFYSTTSSQSDLYGLSNEAIQKIYKYSPQLLITLDFGTTNQQEIQDLYEKGIETIVIDHHEIPEMPHPAYLINPKREDSEYPEKDICTAFLTLKFISCLEYYLSHEFDQIYFLKTAFFEGKYYRNAIPLEIQQAFLPNKEVYINELPGDPRIPTPNRLFYYQLSKIPGFLEIFHECLPLAGIGTITDMMPLTGENRTLIKLTLKNLNSILNGTQKGILGLSELIKHLKFQKDKITAKDIGWTLGPILNSAGRMGKTELALDLLLCMEEKEVKLKIEELIKTNEERKERTKRNLHKMNLYFQRHPHKILEPFVFCYEPDMEPGVSGIVATRMVETFFKPAIFIAPDKGIGKGSIRSYGKENVLDFLKEAKDILDHFGGHKEAGGFSIQLNKIPELEKRLLERASHWLSKENQEPSYYESEVTLEPEDLNIELLSELEKIEPTGLGNPPILLSLKDIEPIYFQFMGDGTHARFKVIRANGIKFVIWREARRFSELLNYKSKISLWGYLEENFYQNKSYLQFLVVYFE